VDWLGFPLHLAVNKEGLSEKQAAEIIAGIQRPQQGILITYEVEAREINAFCRRLDPDRTLKANYGSFCRFCAGQYYPVVAAISHS
jgi:hypothetical protein